MYIYLEVGCNFFIFGWAWESEILMIDLFSNFQDVIVIKDSAFYVSRKHIEEYRYYVSVIFELILISIGTVMLLFLSNWFINHFLCSSCALLRRKGPPLWQGLQWLGSVHFSLVYWFMVSRYCFTNRGLHSLLFLFILRCYIELNNRGIVTSWHRC